MICALVLVRITCHPIRTYVSANNISLKIIDSYFAVCDRLCVLFEDIAKVCWFGPR